MRPAHVDAVIDLAYGALILISIGLIATVDLRVGLTFGLGVFASYILHVAWKMARFDPDWMTQAVAKTVETQVEDIQTQVEETVGETVEETVEETVGETVEKQVEDVQTQVEAVNERVDRRPREDEVEELIEESVEDESET
ncbi:hypothetical protein [Natrinema gelatinilyticum]|uniref:hypothetical protein n=1 Tax=Natrinema gelatinilyticum TaxID=2961571 RepID=UPI0020C35A9C|nr:hypothetical protein [Natrinema gelatinilyticum]